jgi:hypothetical protein
VGLVLSAGLVLVVTAVWAVVALEQAVILQRAWLGFLAAAAAATLVQRLDLMAALATLKYGSIHNESCKN